MLERTTGFYLGSYSLAFIKYGQTAAPKDATGILMMKSPVTFIQVESRAVSLVEGAYDIQILGITLGTTSSLLCSPF